MSLSRPSPARRASRPWPRPEAASLACGFTSLTAGVSGEALESRWVPVTVDQGQCTRRPVIRVPEQQNL